MSWCSDSASVDKSGWRLANNFCCFLSQSVNGWKLTENKHSKVKLNWYLFQRLHGKINERTSLWKDIIFARISFMKGHHIRWGAWIAMGGLWKDSTLGRTSLNRRTSLTKGYHFCSGTHFSEANVSSIKVPGCQSKSYHWNTSKCANSVTVPVSCFLFKWSTCIW